MKHWFKMAACSLALGGMLTGCFGSFSATRKLYGFNDSFSNKFVKTLIMWAFTIVPAYEIFMFGDWLILNTIEFFTGSSLIGNTVDMDTAEDGTVVATTEDGSRLKFTAVADDRMIVERDGVVLGEMQVNGHESVTMTNYATTDVRTLELQADGTF